MQVKLFSTTVLVFLAGSNALVAPVHEGRGLLSGLPIVGPLLAPIDAIVTQLTDIAGPLTGGAGGAAPDLSDLPLDEIFDLLAELQEKLDDLDVGNLPGDAQGQVTSALEPVTQIIEGLIGLLQGLLGGITGDIPIPRK